MAATEREGARRAEDIGDHMRDIVCRSGGLGVAGLQGVGGVTPRRGFREFHRGFSSVKFGAR